MRIPKMFSRSKPLAVAETRKFLSAEEAKVNAIGKRTEAKTFLQGMLIWSPGGKKPERLPESLEPNGTKNAVVNALSIALARSEEEDCDMNAVYRQLKRDLGRVGKESLSNEYENCIKVIKRKVNAACNSVENKDLKDFRFQINEAYRLASSYAA